MANAVKTIAKFIRKEPDSEQASVLRGLCMALENGECFAIHQIYDLDKKTFEMAIGLLEEWRFDRHVVERRLQKYLAQPDDEA